MKMSVNMSVNTIKMSTRAGVNPLVSALTRVTHRQRVSRMFPATEGTEKAMPLQSTMSVGQRLMLAHNLIQSASPGTFHLLPSMTRSLEKLHRLIDVEMQSIGAQKISMPCLAPQHIWNTSKRWEKMGSELFVLKDRNDSMHCLAPTHEEAVTSLVALQSPVSLSRIPIKLYQIGRKFRDEARPKHGLLRCREFEMKDLYTFDADVAGAELTYRQVCDSYSSLLRRLALPFVTVEASTGAMGGDKSQEFHLVSSVGEDILFCCDKCGKGFNQEINDRDKSSLKCSCDKAPSTFVQKSGIEVAHAFILGTLYSKVFNAHYVDKQQKKQPLYMGCFGIGVTRLLAAGVEVLSTTDNLRWPHLLAPHQVCLVPQKEGYKSDVTSALADQLYDDLTLRSNLSSEVVIDDRIHLSIGQRVRQAKSAGFPHIVILGKQATEAEPVLEHIDIYSETTHYVSPTQVIDALSHLQTV